VKNLNPSIQENLEVLLSSDNNSRTTDLQAKSDEEVEFIYIKQLLSFFSSV
jgi:hypothetical protein